LSFPIFVVTLFRISPVILVCIGIERKALVGYGTFNDWISDSASEFLGNLVKHFGDIGALFSRNLKEQKVSLVRKSLGLCC
jgi:hypothetical protein